VRYHAGQWQIVQIPKSVETHTNVGYEYFKIVMTSPEDGWVVAQAGFENNQSYVPYVLRLQHGTWSIASHEFAQAVWQINGVVIQGATAWGYGATSNIDAGGDSYPVVGRYVNDTWQSVPLPANLSGLTGTIFSMSALSANDIWAVGQAPDGNLTDYRPLVLHYDGKSWSQVLLPNGMQEKPWSIDSLVMVSSHEGWLWGTDYSRDQQPGELLLLHYLNGFWQRITSLPKILVGTVQSSAFGGESWALGWFRAGSMICPCPDDGTNVILHLYRGQWQITAQIPQFL
jgi:hypothetical protein